MSKRKNEDDALKVFIKNELVRRCVEPPGISTDDIGI